VAPSQNVENDGIPAAPRIPRSRFTPPTFPQEMPITEENEILLKNTAARMLHLQNRTVQESCAIGIIDFERWEWPQGVGLYGLLRYYQWDKRPEILHDLEGWFRRRRAEGLPEKNINTMAPMLTLAHLYETTRNPADLELCKEWVAWAVERLPRTTENGFQHVTTDFPNKGQLWADTLFMTVLFVAKMGVLLQRQDYVEESIRQFLLHIKYLHDRKTGLWYHGWNFIGRHNFAEALWGRGNCWFTAGVVDYLELVNLSEGVKNHLIATLSAQVDALAQLQESDGMWHTLLDDPRSYLESSATAGFGYGILKGVRLGYLDGKYYTVGRKAVAAVCGRIDQDGTVRDVSYGTPMGLDLDSYRKIPQCPMAYGQALTLLLLTEAVRSKV
jgi:unsaturated rhamnogalacturonyl hydrolase